MKAERICYENHMKKKWLLPACQTGDIIPELPLYTDASPQLKVNLHKLVPVNHNDIFTLSLQAETQQCEGLLAQKELLSSWDPTTLPWYISYKYDCIQFWFVDNGLPWFNLLNGQSRPVIINSNSLKCI